MSWQTVASRGAEQGRLPDALIRFGIRQLCRQRLQDQCTFEVEKEQVMNQALWQHSQTTTIVASPELANEQHYELPAAFFQMVLDDQLKYSCGHFQHPTDDLNAAESAMLALSVQRAEVADGMNLLDLGCGWGALTIYLAQQFPRAHITAVSNSRPQRLFIKQRLQSLQLTNVEVITADINEFEPRRQFDRILSIGLLEHLRNHRWLFARLATWLTPTGPFFVYIFTHRSSSYFFETEGEDNWMGRCFFTGGMILSNHWLLYHQRHLHIERHWLVNGQHYQRTANAWLGNLDRHRAAIEALFQQHYPHGEAATWCQRWRIFFMACAELFGYQRGQQWMVSHYLFAPNGSA